MLALTGLELEALDRVDIGIGRQDAANVAALAAIRVVIDADPESVALDRGELPFEADALAGEGCFEIGVIELVELAAVDFDDFATDDFGLVVAAPVEKGTIDETIALVRVDVTDRQAERVQLALRKRQQGIPFHPFARGLLRWVVEAGQ